MAYKTGYAFAASWAFTLTGTYTSAYNNLAGAKPPEGTVFPLAEATYVINAGDWSVQVAPYFYEVPPIQLAGEARTVRYGATITVAGGGPGTTGTSSVNVYNTYNIPAMSVYVMTYNLGSLAAMIATNAVEWFEALATGLPWFDFVPDAPAPTKARLFLQHLAGGTETVSCGGAALTQSSYSANTGLQLQATVGVTGQAGGTGSGTWSIAINSAPCTYSSATASASSSDTNGSGSANAGASGVTLTLSGTTTTPVTGSAFSTQRGDQAYVASGVVRAMDDAYPDSVLVDLGGHVGGTVTASSGMWTTAGTQKSYDCAVAVPGATDNKALDQHAPLSAALNSAGLTANGDEPRNRRALWRCYQTAGAFTITQSSFWLLTGNSESPSAWNTDTSVSGNVATLSAPVASLAFTPKLSGLSYRYLQFEVKSIGGANTPLSLTIPANDITDDDRYDVSGGGSVEYSDTYTGEEEPDKRWNFTTGDDGEWKTVTIDLCAPHNLTDTTDAQDTRFPLPSRMPLYYGASRITALNVAGVPIGSGAATIQLRNPQFVLKETKPQFDFLPTFYANRGRIVDGQFVLNNDWHADTAQWRATETLDTGTVNEYYQRRFLAGRADGKASIEESDFGYTKTTTAGGNTTWNFTGGSVESLSTSINAKDTVTISPPAGGSPRTTGLAVRYPGITVALTVPPADGSNNLRNGYLNKSLPAIFTAGGGATFDSAGGWHYHLNSQGAVPVQTLYDECQFYPNCGDAFGLTGGTRSGAIQLRAASFLRSGGQALVWDRHAGKPIPIEGRTVTVKEGSPLVSRGTGTTDTDRGYAQTGLPYLRAVSSEVLNGDNEYDITYPTGVMEAQNSPVRTINIRPFPRRRVRGAFRVAVVIKTPGKKVATTTNPGIWAYGEVSISSDATEIMWLRSEGAYTKDSDLTDPVTIVAASGSETYQYPTVIVERSPLERIRVRWVRVDGDNYDVLESQSTDEGATWSTPIVAIPGGHDPILRTAQDGSPLTLEAARVPDSDSSSDGVIKGSWGDNKPMRADGTETPDLFTFQVFQDGNTSDIRVTSDGFDLQHLPQGQSQWLLTVYTPDVDTTKRYVCADETGFVFVPVAS